jgi:hypothetical protein
MLLNRLAITAVTAVAALAVGVALASCGPNGTVDLGPEPPDACASDPDEADAADGNTPYADPADEGT